jgi:O-antigen/teichoic acid export membrane protein
LSAILRTPPLIARASARSPLPEGTLAVGAGLIISGVAAYGFLAIAGHALDKSVFAPLSLLWTVTFVLAPGFFLPIEQELGRALAHRRAIGEGGLPVVRRAGVLALSLLVIVSTIVLLISPLLVDKLFKGRWSLVVALLVAFAGYAAGHFTRGMLSGTGQFGPYGVYMGAEGVLRLTACAALAVAGVEYVGPYGLAVALPPIFALGFVWRGQWNRFQPGPEASWAEITPNLGWLLAGSVLGQTLVNAGPLAVGLLSDGSARDDELVADFFKGVLLARVPLFLFQAVQAALLPKLALLAAQGELTEFRRGFRKLLTVVIAFGVIGTVGAFTIGPVVVELAFNAELGNRTLGLVALASSLYMVALAIAQAVIALHGHAKVAGGWLIGVVTFVAVAAVAGDDLLLRVEIAWVTGTAASLVYFAWALRAQLRAGATIDADSVVEAMHDFVNEP